MATIVTPPTITPQSINYPSGDGTPVAETFDHLYVILITIEVLRQYLEDIQACVLGNQFLYYSQGFPRLKCAPDVMVIFGVEPGSRDSYKIWDEGEIPRVVFEVTSPGTRDKDEGFKKDLYAQIGIEEYWQFDPKGQWIEEKLRGYRLVDETYVPIAGSESQALGLRLEVSGALISFYRLDNGEKLLIPLELRNKAQHLQDELTLEQARLLLEQTRSQELEDRSQELENQLNQAQSEIDRYRNQFGDLP
ncbi:MAG: Uma2 family endonuclease [Alkalinema sp. CAN_BIN05]|nr:Uma2 family endonuclease [Alkalinema sp. CAN_BIN05]